MPAARWGGDFCRIPGSMRMIGTIPGADDAERFSDYLLTQKIDNMVEESPANRNWSVWVEHDDDLDRGKSELRAFLQNPADTKYATAGRADKIRKQEDKAEQRRRQQFIDVRTSWGQPRQWAAPATITLAVICVVVGLATQLGRKMSPVGQWLSIEDYSREQELADELLRGRGVEPGSVQPMWYKQFESVRHGQVWRLVTPMFLHFSVLHLIFNLTWLVQLGRMIEVQRGTWRFVLLVLVSSAIANAVEYWWQGPHFGGMSAVNYALFGYIWVKGRFQPQLSLRVGEQTSMILIAWLFLCMTGWMGPVANAAHVAGLICGAVIAYAPYLFHRLRRAR
jgi:GlpG protein